MTTLRGFLVPDSRIHSDYLDDTLTTATQAGPEPGPAVDQGSSSMVLRTSGSMGTTDGPITISTQRAGYPGSDYRSGAFSYTDDSVEYYWDTPNRPSGWEWANSIISGATITSTYKAFEPHLARLADGTVLMVQREQYGGSYADTRLRVLSFDPSTSTWTSLATLTDDSLSDIRAQPNLVVLPSGRVHLYHLIDIGDVNASGTDDRQLVIWYSDDSGATWTLSTKGALQTVVSTGASDPDIMRVVRSESGQLGIAMRANGALIWLASAGPGRRFQTITINDGVFDDPLAVHLLAEPGGGFRLYVQASGDSDQIRTRAFGNGFAVDDNSDAWETISTLDQIGVLPHSCVWRGEDGAVYLNILGLGTSVPKHAVYRSEDGETFTTMTGGTGQGFWLDVTSDDNAGSPTHLANMATVETRGLSITAAEVVTDSGDPDDGSLILVYSGGYTSQTMPQSRADDLDTGQQAWSETYWAIDDPTVISQYSAAGIGAGSLEVDGWLVDCSTVRTLVYTGTDAQLLVANREIVLEIAGHSVDCNQTSPTRMGLRLTMADATNEWLLYLNFITSGFVIQDGVSGSYSSTYSLDMDAPWEIRVACFEGAYSVWYRLQSDRVERAWTLAITSTVTSQAVTSTNRVTVEWGCHTTGAADHTMVITHLSYVMQPSGYLTDTGAADLPQFPKPFSRFAVALGGPVRVAALSGPTVAGDEWLVSADHRFGFANLDDPSPQVEWRSTGETAIDLVWDLSGFAEDARFLSSSLAVGLYGINFRRFTIVGVTHGGASTTLMTVYASPYLDLGGTLAFDYDRQGRLLQCPSSTTKAETPWVGHGDLVDGYFLDAATGDAFRIEANTSGRWTDDSDVKPLRLLLEGDTSGLGATGTGHILLPSVAAWRHNVDVSDYRYLKLSIPAQDTPDGYFRIGRLMLGPLYVFGRQYSRERGLNNDANVELTTRRDGSRTAYRRGPERRAVEIQWSEGVDESELHLTTQETIETPAANSIVAVPGDTARLTEGLFRQLSGPLTPLVYLPAVDCDTETGTLTSRRGHLYGRVVSPWSADQILGDEESSEIYRINTIRIEEEV